MRCGTGPMSMVELPTEKIAEFWARTERSGECLLWTGKRSGKGYGRVYINGRFAAAHRVAYEIANGAIPDGMLIRHTCDTPPCVEPTHLLVGTQLDNMRDKMERGRHRVQFGESHYRTSLTDEQVTEIRRMRADGFSFKSISDKIGASPTGVAAIANGRRWKHIEAKAAVPIGRGRRSTSQLRCSICDEFGHDIRRCPKRHGLPGSYGISAGEQAAHYVHKYGGTMEDAGKMFGITMSAVSRQYIILFGKRSRP